jgi:2-succinyl-5-enolpyruvyl-6-hydroxy-3-cyclohexene-1-carboxylate synthase
MTQHQLITHTLELLARLGVREVCVAAGARNAPLVAALADSTGVTLWNFFEERSAAFFALGRILVDRLPVAVVTTSGTAAAELLPATIEAYYQGLPLILVTADRPERFRHSGAPQAIEQEGIFGVYAQSLDQTDDLSGPLHFNLCLDEPLTPAPGIDFTAPARIAAGGHRLSPTAHPAPIASLPTTAQLILAAGLHPDDAALVAPALARLRLPIVAEATANLHLFPELHPLLVHGGEKALKHLQAEKLLRLGAVPSWRFWRDLETQPEIEVMNFSRVSFPGLARKENVTTHPLKAVLGLEAENGGTENGGTENGKRQEPPGHSSILTHSPFSVPPCSPSDSTSISNSERPAELKPDFESHPISEPSWMHHLHEALPSGARVFLGNSLPIREWNLVMSMPAKGIHFYANRGANGIDGLISTFLGVAASSENESWLILGDLSALYDLAAPWVLSQLANPKVRLVIINNGGGKIFSRVASLRDLPANARHIIENRHSMSFEPFAKLWGLDYLLVQNPADLGELSDGPVILEIRPDPDQTEAFWAAWQGR